MKIYYSFFGLFLFLGCTKSPSIPKAPELSTNEISGITATGATTGGKIFTGNPPLNQKGICWSTAPQPSLNNSSASVGAGNTDFTYNITGLLPSKKYYVRAYAINQKGIVGYGEERSFFTSTISSPTLTTNAASSITLNAAISGGNIISDGGSAVSQRGVCWNTSGSPTTSNSKAISSTTGTGSYSVNLTNLNPGTTYYIRAYAINQQGFTGYGDQRTFTTSPVTGPTLTTIAASSITLNTAVAGGNITSDGGSAVTQRGVCWNTTGNPTLSNSRATATTTGTGSYSVNLTSLNPGTTYYIRAYATNQQGFTGYGDQLVFTTTAISSPTLTTNVATSVTSNAAVSGGNISSDGGSTVIERGVCWNTSGNPTTSNSKVISSTNGTGSYSVNLTNLNSGTTYYIRAYAINQQGFTGYGDQRTFITTAAALASISTSTVSSITATTALSGGNISSDGGATVTERGVCWNTTGNPTIGNSKAIASATGVGSYSVNISGLAPGTTYYLRAYAINAAGVSYAPNQQTFNTLLNVPILSNPLNGVTLSDTYLNYSWSAVQGATSYEFQLSRTSGFTASTFFALNVCGGSSNPSINSINRAFLNTNSFCANTGSSTNNGLWYWRVRALNNITQSAWSNTFSYNFIW